MQAFLKGHAFFTGAAAALLLLSILCRFATGMLLKGMMKEAENMSSTNNPFLKQCKLKFQNCFELNGGTVNVEAFVGKMLQNVRLGKCSLRLLNFMAGQLLLLSVFADGIGACLGLAYGETLGEVLPYYLLAFFSLYLFFSVSGLIDVQGKQEALKVTMVDFLENRMAERIKSVKEDSAYLEAEEERALQEVGKLDGSRDRHAERLEESVTLEAAERGAGEDGRDELEELLREFLA